MTSWPPQWNPDRETMLVMPLSLQAMLYEFDAQLLACTIRNDVRPFPNAPHGYYVDEQTLEPFPFFDGDDVEVARSRFRASRRGQVASIPLHSNSIEGVQTPTGSSAIVEARQSVSPSQPGDDRLLAPSTSTQPVMTPRPDSGDTMPAPLPLSYLPEPGPASLYTIMINFSVPGNIGLNTRDFNLGIDSTETKLWFYGEKYRRISTNWIHSPTEEWPPKTDFFRPPWDSRVTVPGPTRNPSQAYDDTSAPQADFGEEAVQYRDQSGVFLRHHYGQLPAVVPSWDWGLNKKREFSLFLPYTIAYAANDRMVRMPYDGIIGLGVYDPPPYHQSLKTGEKAWGPSLFTIHLTHPDTKIPQDFISSNGLFPFVSFGPYFPCTETTPLQWTPRVYVQRGPAATYTTWRVELESMALLVPKADTDPRYDSEDGFEALVIKTGFPVVLDTGSICSMFPAHVVDQIKDSWLRNEPGNRSRRPYCGPERNLKDCDVVFTFVSGSERVKFRCSAARFLSTPWNFGHFGAHEASRFAPRDDYKECAIAGMEPAPSADSAPMNPSKDFVLGMGIYWSAFVFHFSDPDGNHIDNPPYIRLAAERVLDKQGKPTVLTEQYFQLKGGPPRYSQRLDQ